MRRSDNHPRVQSRPNQIIDETRAFIQNLRRLRSQSPDMRGFSRFSSRPSTPGTSTPHPPFQHPTSLHPPAPPPTARQPRPPLPDSRSGPHPPTTTLGAPPWPVTVVMPGCRAPIPSKCKQRFGAVSCKKRSIETQLAVNSLFVPRSIVAHYLPRFLRWA